MDLVISRLKTVFSGVSSLQRSFPLSGRRPRGLGHEYPQWWLCAWVGTAIIVPPALAAKLLRGLTW